MGIDRRRVPPEISKVVQNLFIFLSTLALSLSRFIAVFRSTLSFSRYNFEAFRPFRGEVSRLLI